MPGTADTAGYYRTGTAATGNNRMPGTAATSGYYTSGAAATVGYYGPGTVVQTPLTVGFSPVTFGKPRKLA